MGEVHDSFGIWTSDGFYQRNLRMQADTGAVYCQLPEGLLREMGWAPNLPSRSFILADGSRVTADLGTVRVRYNGVDSDETFVFGEDGSTPLIGVELLQNRGLGVDPVNHRLILIERQH